MVKIAPGRSAWLQILRGNVTLLGEELDEADGAALTDEKAVDVRAEGEAEVMLFDLA